VVLADPLFLDGKIHASVKARLKGMSVLAATDITVPAQVNRLVADTMKRFGRIDCLVNSAGISRPAPIQETDPSDWEAVIGVNLTGAFLLSRAVAPVMIRQKHGRIIHIASTAAHTAAAGLSAYAASKHGLVGLVKGMACDLTQYGITVNAVCPGNNDTEMLAKVIAARARLQGRSPEEIRMDIVRKTPAGRLGQPCDIAAAVIFLTSDEAAYITGQALIVDGGRSLNLM
jgi:NAD(P)-dependent dehydrogenase (short-subunit alcohol dehydrogenase family)